MDKKVLVVAPDSFDVSDMGTDMLEAQVLGDISDDEHEVAFEATFDIAFEVEWEDDGEPTYVPYGSTSVLYDSGEGGIDHIELVDIDLTIDSWIDVTDDPDGVELTDDEVEQLFGINVDEIKRQILDALDTYVRKNARHFIYYNAEKPDIDWLDEEYLSEDISDGDIDKDIDKNTHSDEEIAAAKKRIMPGYHYNGKYDKKTIDKAKRRAELIKGADKACNEEIDPINVAADLDLAKDAKWNKKISIADFDLNRISIDVDESRADPNYHYQYFSINIPYKGDANIIEKNTSDGLFYNGWISEGLIYHRGYKSTREEPAECPCYEPDGNRKIEISGWSLSYIEYDDPNIATVKWNNKHKAYEIPLEFDDLTDSKTLSELLNIKYDDLLKLENICKEKALKEIEGSWFYADSDGEDIYPGEEIR